MATLGGVLLISAATLILELALLRLFAVQQFYHFAFMAISLALLGAGASGSLLSISNRRASPPLLSLAFAIAAGLAYLTINYLPFDSFSIAWDRRQFIFLSIYFLAAAVPFLFSGLIIGGELMKAGRPGGAGSHQIYAANLVGSALGSLASLLLLDWFEGPGTVLIAMVAGAFAGLIFTLQVESPIRRNRFPKQLVISTILILLIGLSLGILFLSPSFWQQRLSPYKTLSIITQALDSRRTLTTWDETVRIDVVESDAIHVMPGLSLLSSGSIPPQAGLLLDGDNLMPITNLDPDSPNAQELADYLPSALAFKLRPEADTLIVESGTGLDILLALASGASKVTALEENEGIIHILEHEYSDYSAGLFKDSRVVVVNQSGRVYARRPDVAQHDLVIVALTDPHRPVTSGAFSLTEDYVYTLEAFEDYQRLLKKDGLIAVTRWLQSPPSESARTFATIAAAWANSSRDPADHLIAFRTMRTMTILASERPYTEAELTAVRSFLQSRAFDPVYLPGIQKDELNRFNRLPEPVYYQLFVDILENPKETFAVYDYDTKPATDDQPFFYHFFRWRQTPEILAGLGRSWQPFGGSGFLVLVLLLGLVSAAAALFILGPLFFRKTRLVIPPSAGAHGRGWIFIYFAGLGLAYLFIEVTLAQRFILILGKPVTALAVVLFAMLFFSGIGSLTSRYWSLTAALPFLVIVVVFYPFFLDWLSPLALPWSLWAKVLFTAFSLIPLSFLMGIPFAGGLYQVERVDNSLVPWVWAINGSFSVISSVLAVMFALTWGFPAVLWIGAGAYGLAWLAFIRGGRNKG